MAGFALPHGLVLGDLVLVAEPGPVRGLGQLREFVEAGGETRVDVHFPADGRSLLISEAGARMLTRPLSASEAESMLRALDATDTRADERSPEDQYITSIKTLSRGTWDEIARQLAVLYASPWKPGFGDSKMIRMYEVVVVPILAQALQQHAPQVVERIRARKPVFVATEARPEVPEPPLPPASPYRDGWESLFPIELTGEIWIGERPDWHDLPDAESGLVRLHVTPGKWHSYRRNEEDDDHESVDLLLVHDAHIEAVAGAKWKKRGEILAVVGGNSINVVDRRALADESTMDRVRYLGGVCEYGGNALCVATQRWDGPIPVFVHPSEGLPTMVKIRLQDPAG